MKRLLCLCAMCALVFAASVCAAGEINLVGEWQGPLSLHSKKTGFVSRDGSNGSIFIVEQKDGAFYGKRVWSRSGKERMEEFSGVISADGKRLYFAGHDDGYFFGEVLGPDEIVTYYIEDGDEAKAIRRVMKRLK